MENKRLKIGVIKPDGIGDAVLASPFFLGLRRHFKEAEIIAFMKKDGADILSGSHMFNRAVITEPAWLKYKKTGIVEKVISFFSVLFAVNSQKCDILIGLRHRDRLSSLLLSLAFAKEKYGYDVSGMGFGINHKINPVSPDTHEADKNMEILKFITGMEYHIMPQITTDKEAEKSIKALLNKWKVKKYVVIHPVSGHSSKDWGAENYSALADGISRGIKTVVIGAKNDMEAFNIRGRHVLNLTGMLTIKETAALIKHACLVIGNDSAAVHIASALNIPSLTIFSGAAMYEEFGAVGKKAFIITKSVPCRGCELKECTKNHECMDIKTQTVIDAAIRILYGKQKEKVIRV